MSGFVLDALPDLMDADDPLAWAHDNLLLLGQGDTSSVFAFPGDPALVVRVSDYPDGWFGYAMEIGDMASGDETPPEMDEAVARHAPMAHEMRDLREGDTGYIVAVCERLDGLDAEGVRLAGAARAVLTTPFPPCFYPDEPAALFAHGRSWADRAIAEGKLDPAAADELLASQPYFLAFAQGISGDATDLRVSNWMMRGRHLVLNDPVRTMSSWANEAFSRRFGTAQSTLAPR